DFSASYVNTSLSGLTGNTFNFNITVNDSSNPIRLCFWIILSWFTGLRLVSMGVRCTSEDSKT
ncbi:MAG: hypothetical protein PHO74_06035, partial [Weeksellaceae bacterium]|nr:hypothetical protein [Weeksellaceae bacterium]